MIIIATAAVPLVVAENAEKTAFLAFRNIGKGTYDEVRGKM